MLAIAAFLLLTGCGPSSPTEVDMAGCAVRGATDAASVRIAGRRRGRIAETTESVKNLSMAKGDALMRLGLLLGMATFGILVGTQATDSLAGTILTHHKSAPIAIWK